MEKEKVDIELFYKTDPYKGIMYDGPNPPFEFEVNTFINNLKKFFTDESIDDMLFLLIKIFKDTYPNISQIHKLIGKDSKEITNEGKRTTDTSTGIYRKDIKEALWYYIIQKYYDETYKSEREGFFLEKIEIIFKKGLHEKMVTNSISEKEYERQESGNIKTFILSDSPISKIIIDGVKFILEFNPEKYKYYL
ncbi:MAG: hypothetical protein POELPBGB_01328 [Bacteroidia bacterium]|nr:hypothetical protein [Bacteroidia bacterium]